MARKARFGVDEKGIPYWPIKTKWDRERSKNVLDYATSCNAVNRALQLGVFTPEQHAFATFSLFKNWKELEAAAPGSYEEETSSPTAE